jgi:hypothetical protein
MARPHHTRRRFSPYIGVKPVFRNVISWTNWLMARHKRAAGAVIFASVARVNQARRAIRLIFEPLNRRRIVRPG